MTTPVIIDLVAAAVLLGFTAFGVKRGLFKALAGLVAVVIALVGAGLVAASFSAPVTGVITPFVTQKIEEKVCEAVEEQSGRSDWGEWPEEAGEIAGVEIPELLSVIGYDADVHEELMSNMEEKVVSSGMTAVTAMAESLLYSFVYAALYLIAFVLLLLLMKVLIGAMNLVLKLPGLRTLNALGGAVIGFSEGALLLFLAVWVLRRLGVSFETELLAQTNIFRIFTANTPLGVLMSLFQ